MIRSSIIPPSHSARKYTAGADLEFLGVIREHFVEPSPAHGPVATSWPMCEISKTPTLFRTAWCSSRMLVYWTGMIQSPNGIIFAPSRRCSS